MREHKFKVWDKDRKMLNAILTVGAIARERSQLGENLEFYESTGLLDKNGKEIYEGDIVQWNGENRVVSYCNCYSCGRYELDLHEEDRAGVLSSEPENWNETEVIGTIYQDPELLKGGEKL